MNTVVVYHWNNGAYVNSYADNFEELYQGLVSQFGVPTIAMTYEENAK